ncbi:MAG: hypothetical protein HW421_4077 [Ignavibacteria bacterium]|nr:hypothetical protein [Ignavibacteria bacterium]
MENIKEILIDLWEDPVKKTFEDGFLTYERQLQGYLYYLLKSRKDNEFEIWIEPVIYFKEPVKNTLTHGIENLIPDIVITKDDEIIAIIEIKSKAWGDVCFNEDIYKLKRYEAVSNISANIILGYIPKETDWHYNGTKHYKLKEGCLFCFISITNNKFEINKLENELPDNFLHLYGYLDNKEAKFSSFNNTMKNFT